MQLTAFAEEVPPLETIRQRLATVAAEGKILRALMKLALKKERERSRIARLRQANPGEGSPRD